MRRREWILITSCLLIAAGVFLTGITWGLPSRAADPYLFGERTPWTGRQIIDLAGRTVIPEKQGPVQPQGHTGPLETKSGGAPAWRARLPYWMTLSYWSTW